MHAVQVHSHAKESALKVNPELTAMTSLSVLASEATAPQTRHQEIRWSRQTIAAAAAKHQRKRQLGPKPLRGHGSRLAILTVSPRGPRVGVSL